MRRLAPNECWARLGDASVIRLALTEAAMPLIVPARHRVVGQDVVIGVGGGRLLRAALAGDIVCVEADGEVDGGAWSVSATGKLELVADADRLRELRPLVARPWDGTPIRHIARVGVAAIDGALVSIRRQSSEEWEAELATITGH